jgi:hypothetical protein
MRLLDWCLQYVAGAPINPSVGVLRRSADGLGVSQGSWTEMPLKGAATKDAN